MKQAVPVPRLNGTWWSWTGALVTTLALNLALFWAIQHLTAPPGAAPALGPMIPTVQLTRPRQPKTPLKREQPKPPAEARQKKRPKKPTINRAVSPPPALAFDTSPPLPGSPRIPVLPRVLSNALDSLTFDPVPDPVIDPVFNAGDLDQPLAVLSRVPPVYPFKAKRLGIEGWVSVEFTVTEQGRAADIRIIEARPQDMFNESVFQCLSAWRFQPGRIGGEPVKTRVRTRIRFDLK